MTGQPPREPSRTSGRTLLADPTFGVAGDMLLAALIDAGADEGFVRACVEAVLPATVEVRVSRTSRRGMAATAVDVVLLRDDQPHRSWREVRRLIEEAPRAESEGRPGLPQPVRDTALAVFGVLAEAEGRVHGVPAEDVHFHEVGAWDSIADIVGVAAGLHSLAVERIVASPVSVGSGTVRAAHGLMPVPVPAVLELLAGSPLHWRATPPGVAEADDAPVATGELATPTGVAVLVALAEPADPALHRRSEATGVGAGSKDFEGWPNVVRVSVGVPGTEPSEGLHTERLSVIEANLDDVDPRVWPSVLDAVLEAGARDVWLTPLTGKKGRTGQVISVLIQPEEVDPGVVASVLFEGTGTLGVREYPVRRHSLPRSWKQVELASPLTGRVRIKFGHRHGRIVHASAEYDDCARIATSLRRPVAQVLDAARAAAEQEGLRPGEAVP